MLTATLITLGDPATMTGGYGYHRRMAELAGRNEASLTFVSLPPRLAALFGLRAVRARADVVLVDSIVAAWVAPWFVLRRPSRLAAVVHQPPGGIDHRALRRRVQAWLDRLLYRRCDQVIIASELLADQFPGAVVVPPGRDLPAPGGRCELRGGARAAALCVASWLPNKGIAELLDAVALLPPGMLRLHLAGDERAGSPYHRRVLSRLGELDGTVVRHGPRSRVEIGRLYGSADFFVLPSAWETYGTVYAEAMTAGLPVVGWRSGNLPRLITDGREGLTVDRDDVPALARALARLAADEPGRTAMADAARRRARALPTWEQSARQFFQTLRRMP